MTNGSTKLLRYWTYDYVNFHFICQIFWKRRICELSIEYTRTRVSRQTIQLHFSHDGCSVLQKLLKYSIVSYLSPPTNLESHTCTKNNWLLLFYLTKIKKKLIRTSHELFSYFTEIVLSRRNTMESPRSKWGLCDKNWVWVWDKMSSYPTNPYPMRVVVMAGKQSTKSHTCELY